MTFLTAKAFDFDDGQTLDADVLKCFFHFVEFERLDNRFDLFHGDSLSVVAALITSDHFCGQGTIRAGAAYLLGYWKKYELHKN
jgi:hypothetical protein